MSLFANFEYHNVSIKRPPQLSASSNKRSAYERQEVPIPPLSKAGAHSNFWSAWFWRLVREKEGKSTKKQ